ncbi:MAG: ATP-binding cassette domain-containing protein [Coriobacteriales bacterium]|nr:ATP-binding cassette domain-containing protein [Coriobacteriales bacterium]
MAIAVDRLRFAFETDAGPHQALDGITLEIPEGSFACIVGGTGSGKTTLLLNICGLMVPTSGRLAVDGIDVASKGAQERIRKFASMAFQLPERQFFEESVLEDVAYGPENLGKSPEMAQEAARRALASMGLDPDEFGPRTPFKLSGGEMRRAALAGTIACEPKYLLLDEPTSGLDNLGRASILSYLRELHAAGTTIVMATHDLDAVLEYADTVFALADGRLVAQGDPAEVLGDEGLVASIGLDMPHALRLANSLGELGIELAGKPRNAAELAQLLACALNDRGEVAKPWR